MPTLYVTEPGAVVRRQGKSLTVTLDEDPDGKGPAGERRRRLIEVEPHRLDLIALVGRVHMTSNATLLCLEQGIAVAWFGWNGDFLGRMVPELSRTADLRLAQYRIADSEQDALSFARTVVRAKLLNGAAVLSSLRSNRPGSHVLGHSIAELRAMVGLEEKAETRQVLLGIEGDAARCYFAGLSAGFTGEIRFDKRARRPPPDPANALLSFGYVLMANSLSSLLEGRGFDPFLGFMHTVRSGRPSLALDLMEEFRPAVVDRFVLRTCNRRQLRPEHFNHDEDRGGVRLTKKGMRMFFRAWEDFMDRPLPADEDGLSPEDIMRRQVDRLADHVRGKASYRPLILRQR